MHTKYTCTHHTHWGREKKTEWGKRQRDTIGHLMCKWPTVRAPRNGLAFYFIWFCDFWFWLCLLLLATYVCLHVLYVCVCVCILPTLCLRVDWAKESEANRARRLLVIKCSVLLLNQKPNARILFRTATKLTPLLLLLLLLPPLRRCCHCCHCRRRQLSVCVCVSATHAHTAAARRMCCRFFRFLLPTPRFPLTNTCTHIYMHAYIAYTFCPVLTHGVPLL